MKTFFVTLALLLVLAACNTLTGTRRHVDDPRTFLSYAATDKDVKTVIVSHPALSSRSKLVKHITKNLNDSYRFLRTNFTTSDSSSMVKPYKVVFAFNPQQQTASGDICAAPGSLKLAPPSKRLIIVAVFCGDSLITEVTANVDYAGINKTANLNDAIKQLAANLIPQEEPIRSFGE